MAFIKHTSDHTIGKLRKTMSGGKGMQAFNRLMQNKKARKMLLEEMGKPMADVEDIKKHIATETNRLGSNLYNKKQVLERFRVKWGLGAKHAEEFLGTLVPEKTGPTKEQQAKTKKRNIADIRRLGNVGSLSRFAGDTAENRAQAVRKKVLQPHVPGAQANQGGGLASVTSLVGHRQSSVTAGLETEATGVVGRSGELEVKDGSLKVETREGSGLAKELEKAVASVHELKPKKKEKEAPESEHHDDTSHQIPLVA